ncbi:GNAT family N-acetyltransferase [Paludicola sp. MB14-C6]|uniref:GNAT family N-acetyltransferase n=1 Tax=Paludihabitans sp. MB14-C6 TaxID=3070656 RepID=UPI0027DE26EF|nr:GNAT family N-acetyltransferase [Paludicola sp. MB14-C6]WMJ22359.1 GNAT family N-acetyltransferase [Paludicola sp. MB14-C6]
MIIRRVTSDDYMDIYNINKESLGYDYSEDKTKMQLEKIMQLQSNIIFVAQQENHVIGYIHLSEYENTYHDSLKNIVTFAVAKNYQNHGVGEKLITAAEEWAKESGSRGIRLVTGHERKAARKFYAKHGYELRKEQSNLIKWF